MRSKNNLSLRTLKWLATRSLTVFFILWLLSSLMIDHSRLTGGAKIRALEYFKPASFAGIVRFIAGDVPLARREWAQYAYYYQRLSDYAPGNAATWLMRGFCDYYLEDRARAKEEFKKAFELDPKVFWSAYDLAVIYFQEENYDKVVPLLEHALAQNPGDTLAMMSSSQQIFAPIFAQAGIKPAHLLPKLKEGHKRAYGLLVLSYFYQRDYEGVLRSAQLAVKSNVGDAAVFSYYAGLPPSLPQDADQRLIKELSKEKGPKLRVY